MGPPTVIDVQVDVGYSSILVNRSPGVAGVWEMTPEELGLSEELSQRLTGWLDGWHVLSNRWINDLPETEGSRRAEEESGRELVTLAFDVQHALAPDVEVTLFGLPPGDHRR
ncbi:hypothetical protein O2W14_04870 [Modestobacter sp. VKM Ac-2986]|uniref:hypothetical protein n=1 Tax=Modestobacter sp. VKM Ac-2986 TaxID=3004140 RepID=UPI0022AAC0D4|nr:hypothetical protein [Modestobacter sp. VKM Ac-2986]MCZ2828168.1 hypothetical protein [Modestobacter sp. VKM Ac-2986]